MDSHTHKHDHTEANLKVVFLLNALFALVELAGGVLTNSVAILSNALHDAGDSVALGVAIYFQRVSNRKRDEVFTFGYKRFSVLGALINSLILLSGSCFILAESIPRLSSPQPVNEKGMLLLALLGMAVNTMAMLRIRKGHTQNEKVVSLHMLEDILGWGAVLLVSGILFMWDIPLLDPLLSIAITLFILYRLYGSFRQTFRILLQGTPIPSQEEDIRQKLLKIPGITDIHDLHVWTMDGDYHVASLHIEVDADMGLTDTGELKSRVRDELLKLKIEHATLEIELKGQQCVLNDC